MDEQPKLKNEFRDEVRDPYAGIPEDELVTRDQNVLRKELNFHIDTKEADREHIEGAIEKSKALRMELLALPKSPYREECLHAVDDFILNNTKKLDAFKPPRSMFVTLLALEELFAEPKILDSVAAETMAIASELHHGPLINLPSRGEPMPEPAESEEEAASDSVEAPELSDE